MRHSKKPLIVALSAAFALAGAGSAFAAQDLASGYMVASIGDKAGEAKCGEAKCGEAKCGADKFTMMDTNKDGSLSKAEFMAGHKAGEHKCGEGKCGAAKKAGEAKCGEGKCGADKKK